ncbi:hypothetical protein N431DRAFT_220119 [Stipitochalara longipes BDJ]|nr:hypothetical protein N431DRAFT_220119 [Stipitochalara longipes BDJ]
MQPGSAWLGDFCILKRYPFVSKASARGSEVSSSCTEADSWIHLGAGRARFEEERGRKRIVPRDAGEAAEISGAAGAHGASHDPPNSTQGRTQARGPHLVWPCVRRWRTPSPSTRLVQLRCCAATSIHPPEYVRTQVAAASDLAAASGRCTPRG